MCFLDVRRPDVFMKFGWALSLINLLGLTTPKSVMRMVQWAATSRHKGEEDNQSSQPISRIQKWSVDSKAHFCCGDQAVRSKDKHMPFGILSATKEWYMYIKVAFLYVMKHYNISLISRYNTFNLV